MCTKRRLGTQMEKPSVEKWAKMTRRKKYFEKLINEENNKKNKKMTTNKRKVEIIT